MLDAETKRRIDSARRALVGKIPDPKSQVEQITIALIYKFMADLDAESEEKGGIREFFTGDFERFEWPKLMHSGLGGHEVLNLYAEAIERIQENPALPRLFRAIFKNAFLPYRDPETLRGFLKIIDEFEYDHSERLGDAFEYLLSVLGAQGDAGQFRTPRHIIDFIVEIIDPKKEEAILDPACGTSGFLISSYKHIKRANTDEGGNNTMTPSQRKNLAKNITGYDISPDMVRLSLVNLYLHNFVNPQIHEYDTLTSEEKWDEYFDVILANPPFMTPTGGIRPHNRFSVRASRSEVLFVDYIAEHLAPNGRAGIIVPEGIIFKNENAYIQLRKVLLENTLVAIISLPAGVFKPYSGVKTSVLILDRALAKKTDTIGFFKVENDGFDLGDQRRPIPKNDLPQVQSELRTYLRHGSDGSEKPQITSGLVVSKEKVASGEGYNLMGDRYEVTDDYSTKWPIAELGDVCQIFSGSRPKGGAVNSGVLSIGGEHINSDGSFNLSSPKYIPENFYKELRRGKIEIGDVLVVKDGATTGKTGYFDERSPFEIGAVNEHVFILRSDKEKILPFYLYRVLKSDVGSKIILSHKVGAAQGGINLSIRKIKFPLPPLEVQQELVAEIEDYQKAIDGAREHIGEAEQKIQATIARVWCE